MQASTTHRPDARSWEYAFLRYATLVYALGLLVHTVDHLRRGVDVLTPQVFWAGNVSTLAGVAVIILVLAQHRLAPVVATAFGLPVAVGIVAVHLLPHWSAFSDAFPGSHHTGVGLQSWTVVMIEIAGALALSVGGALVLRQANGREIANS